MSLLIFILVMGGVAAGAAVAPVWTRARRRRLRPVLDAIRRAERHMELKEELPGQRLLAQRLGDWEKAREVADASIQKVRETEFPVPEPPGLHEGMEQTLRRLAGALGNPKLAVAAAGGEQLVQNLFEIVPQRATEHFANAAAELFRDGLLQTALTAATGQVGSALTQYATSQGIMHVLQHHDFSADALAHIPGHVVDTLQNAGTEVFRGVTDMAHLNHGAGGLLDHAHHASHADAATSAVAHVPWLTLALSSVREVGLLLDEKTSAARAIKHVALDAAATGGGALLGGKTGAFIGSFAGPVGTLIGGIIGAVGGGIAGRAGAEKVKRMKLEELAGKLEAKVGEARHALDASGRTFAGAVREQCQAGMSTYLEVLGKSPEFEVAVQQDAVQVEAANALVARLHAEIEAISREAGTEIEAIRVPPAALWETLLGLNVGSAAHRAVEAAHQRRAEWAMRARQALPARGSNPAEVYRTLAAARFPRAANAGFIDAAQKATLFHAPYMGRLGEWMGDAAVAFQAGALAVGRAVFAEMTRHQAEVTRWRERLEELEEQVGRECDALGIPRTA